MTSDELIDDLIERTKQNINKLEHLKQQRFPELNWKPDPDTWSALECIEHLNRYGLFYVPEMSKTISGSRYAADKIFKSGVLGDYFAKMMLPREKLNKMKTLKDKNPAGSQLDATVLDTFAQQQFQTLELLDKARAVSLNKNKTPVSIAPWLKLKLGDTFRVVIYHNQRHLEQALKILADAKRVIR